MQPLNVKTPGGSRAQGEAAVQGDLNSAQVTPHGRSNVIKFSHKRRTAPCCYCGVPLVACNTCATCNEWLNLLARIAGRAAMPKLIDRP